MQPIGIEPRTSPSTLHLEGEEVGRGISSYLFDKYDGRPSSLVQNVSTRGSANAR